MTRPDIATATRDQTAFKAAFAAAGPTGQDHFIDEVKGHDQAEPFDWYFANACPEDHIVTLGDGAVVYQNTWPNCAARSVSIASPSEDKGIQIDTIADVGSALKVDVAAIAQLGSTRLPHMAVDIELSLDSVYDPGIPALFRHPWKPRFSLTEVPFLSLEVSFARVEKNDRVTSYLHLDLDEAKWEVSVDVLGGEPVRADGFNDVASAIVAIDTIVARIPNATNLAA